MQKISLLNQHIIENHSKRIMNASIMKKILILGGSSEAFSLAETLENNTDYKVISSLAGRTSIPRKPAGTYRTGGFGGSEGLVKYLTDENIHAIIDATHPFAEKITINASLAAKKTNCPIIHISRPEWQKQKNDNWIEVPTMQEAAKVIDAEHTPCFLTIGRLELSTFINRNDIQFLCRAIEPPKNTDPIKQSNRNPKNEDEWPDNFKFIYAKGPYNYQDEKKLIKEHGIKCIVTKNSGGEKAKAKLDVAKDLNIPVIMIKRPPSPKGLIVKKTEDALKWLEKI